jgi:PiT family inorganic phosphate transporter
MSGTLALAVAFFLAFANGANDVSKGIATLVGSGVADYRRAIAWGAAWTAVGGLLGSLFGGAMLATFGHGLIASGVAPTFAAALATLCGAAAWVLIATRAGLPVSTTHAIVGSLAGVAALAYGASAVQWSVLWGKVALPLLVSPAAAFVLTSLLLRTRIAKRADCICSELAASTALSAVASSGFARTAPALAPASLRLHVSAGTTEACAAHRPFALRLTVDHLHWLTSGATSLARGMNDAPKIVALLLAAFALAGGGTVSTASLFAIVTLAMVAGSLAAGGRVTRVLAEKVTVMDHRDGFAANLITAGLVVLGAVRGLPMSTTHVSSGGIIGAGSQKDSLNRRTLKEIALAWVVTVPGAAALGMSAYEVARALGA